MDKELSETERRHEADQLIILVEVVLRRDVVFAAVWRACEVQLGDKCDIGVMEWHKPQGEDLRDVEIENKILLVISWKHR